MKPPVYFSVAAVALSLLLAAARPARAQSVSGRINEWGNRAQGIAQVLVQVFEQGTAKKVGEVFTDASGKYELGALPVGVALELRFEKDHYLRHPLVWRTTLASNDARATHDDQMCLVRPGARGDGPKFNPASLAQYLKASSADEPDRSAFYRAQWKALEELHLTPTTLGQVATALAREDPEALALPEIRAAKETRMNW